MYGHNLAIKSLIKEQLSETSLISPLPFRRLAFTCSFRNPMITYKNAMKMEGKREFLLDKSLCDRYKFCYSPWIVAPGIYPALTAPWSFRKDGQFLYWHFNFSTISMQAKHESFIKNRKLSHQYTLFAVLEEKRTRIADMHGDSVSLTTLPWILCPFSTKCVIYENTEKLSNLLRFEFVPLTLHDVKNYWLDGAELVFPNFRDVHGRPIEKDERAMTMMG